MFGIAWFTGLLVRALLILQCTVAIATRPPCHAPPSISTDPVRATALEVFVKAVFIVSLSGTEKHLSLLAADWKVVAYFSISFSTCFFLFLIGEVCSALGWWVSYVISTDLLLLFLIIFQMCVSLWKRATIYSNKSQTSFWNLGRATIFWKQKLRLDWTAASRVGFFLWKKIVQLKLGAPMKCQTEQQITQIFQITYHFPKHRLVVCTTDFLFKIVDNSKAHLKMLPFLVI